MLNELLPVMNKAIKDNFLAYSKMVRCDVLEFITHNSSKDGVVSADVARFAADINSIVEQVGKDLEKQMNEKISELKKEHWLIFDKNLSIISIMLSIAP